MLINKKSPHGGDIYTNHVRLDFSANINPAGMPEKVRQALIQAAESCSAYPDPYCSELRKRIAETERISENGILCGNGAAELIYQFAYTLPKGKPALIVEPAFCEYENALQAAGIAALDCVDWLRDSVMGISEERRHMTEELGQLGIRVYPGETNYLLLYADVNLTERLMERGIMVRDCSNYIGLGRGYVRVAVRTPEENEQLFAEMKEVMV